MVRTKRRVKAPPPKNGGENPSPKKKSTKSDFQGKLSHASPVTRITSYFKLVGHVTDETNVVGKETDETAVKTTPVCDEAAYSRLSPRKHGSTAMILQQANSIDKKSPHRIEMNLEDFPDKKEPKLKRKLVDEQTTCKTGKLTDFFPVRRSVRKTKKTVMEEKQKSIEKAVLEGKEDGLEVHVFPGKGRGIMTTKNFARGDFVVEYAGELISMEEARIRESLYSQDQNTGCYMYYFVYRNTNYCVDATAESPRLGRLVNHSRNGNLVTKPVMVEGVPRLVLIAKEDIGEGEELTYDYGDRSKESLRYHPWLAS